MKLHLMRHGQTDWNLERRIQGHKDVPLNATGRKQVAEFCQKALRVGECGRNAQAEAGSNFDTYTAILSSPLRRAFESAQLCMKSFGVSLEVAAEFSERRFGTLEGMTRREIRRKFGIEDVEALQEGWDIEPMSAFQSRIQDGLQRLQRQYGRERVLLITHGSVIRSIAMSKDLVVRDTPFAGSAGHGIASKGNENALHGIVPNGHLIEVEWR